MADPVADETEPGGDGNRTGRRRSPRRTGTVNVQFGQHGKRHQARLIDLSRHGARLSVAHALLIGETCWISLPGLQPISSKIAWVEGYVIGCQFETTLHEAVFDHLLTKVEFGGVVDRRADSAGQ